MRRAAGLSYVELLSGGAHEDQTLPLIVAIHGLGDDPHGFAGVFFGFDTPARIVLPQGPDRYAKGYSWFEFHGQNDEVDKQAQNDEVDKQARAVREIADRVARAIVQIEKVRPTSGKAIVTGFSQGGVLSFALAALHPELIAEAYPVSGWLPPPLAPASPVRKLAVVALHGTDDPLVAVGSARRSIRALKQAGYAASLETFAGVGHALSPAMHQRLFELLADACQQAQN